MTEGGDGSFSRFYQPCYRSGMLDVSNPRSFSADVAHGVFWVSTGAFAVRVIGFLTSIFLLRAFSLHEYGTYQLVLSTAGLLALATLQGIDEVIFAAGAKSVSAQDSIGMRHLLRGFWAFKMATGILAWAFIFFASGFLQRWYSGDILFFLRTYAWVFLLLPFERVILFSYSVHRQFKRSSLYGFLQEFLKGVLIVLFVGVFHLGVKGILLAMILAMFLTVATFGFRPFSVMFLDWRGTSLMPFFRLLKAQGVWTIAQRLLRQGEKNARPLLIQAMLGREAVALFSFAEKVYGYAAGIFPLSDVLMPSVAGESQNRERLQRVLVRGIKYTVPFYTVIALGIALIAPIVIPYAFPLYASGLPVLYGVLCYFPFIGLAYLMTAFFVSHQEQAAQFWAICVRESIFLMLLPLCIWLFGVTGLGIEFFLTLSLYNVVRIFLLWKKYPELSFTFGELFRIDSYDRQIFQRVRAKINRYLPFSKT